MEGRAVTTHCENIIGRPQVVLFGNGMGRLLGGDDWDSLLDNFADLCPVPRDNYLRLSPQDRYEILTCADKKRAQDCLKQSLKELELEFETKIKRPENAEVRLLFNSLFDIDTDVILTTNFTKDIEMAGSPELLRTKCKKICNDASAKKTYVGAYRFDQYSVNGGVRRLFRIHGDFNRSLSSVTLSSDKYISVLTNVIDHVNEYSNRDTEEKNKLKSWTEMFLVGDVYIVGMGLDFCEQDLWWLLRHKCGEGSITFYTPDNESDNIFVAQKYLLRVYGYNINTMHYKKSKGINTSLLRRGAEKSYLDFYNSAIADIRDSITQNRKDTKDVNNYAVELKEVVSND